MSSVCNKSKHRYRGGKSKPASCLLLLAVIISLVGGPSNAEQGVLVIGYQTTTCGTWTKERRGASLSRAAYEGWITGFLSGWAIAQKPTRNPLADLDSEAVLAWTDNYCSAHPLDILSVAGVALMNELLARAKSSN
jgi:hypothetical protein